ncbi:MAG TPA: UDP-phosphate galactose phosphotransferase [Syntrophobacteraceae bacterium]|nr:UDP-phosphate galactose phosphotransferase [Syntrophobacteraceae bacterium]
MDNDLLDKIVISFFLFPEEDHKKLHKEPPSEALYPDLTSKSRSRTSILAKRSLDIVGSLFCLLLFSPFFLIFSLLIKLTSKGPVLFKQERIGQFGRKFKCLKFRSMYLNNDPTIHKQFVQQLIAGKVDVNRSECGGGTSTPYKIQRDPRVTPIGNILRKSSLDELPQFWNVFVGDMSLVGPRPPIAYEVECYDVWHKRRVLEVKPGITGLWQVVGRSSTAFDDMVRLDLKYVRDWSIWLDIKLLLKTPWVVITGKGGH